MHMTVAAPESAMARAKLLAELTGAADALWRLN